MLLFLIFLFLCFLIQCRDWEDGMLHRHIHWLSAAERRGSRGRTKYCLPAPCRQVRKQDGVIEISGLSNTATSNPPHFIDMTALRSWVSMLKSTCCRQSILKAFCLHKHKDQSSDPQEPQKTSVSMTTNS